MPALVAYGDGPWAPTVDPDTVARLCDLDGPPDVLLGWTVEELPWLAAMPPGRVTTTTSAGVTEHGIADLRDADLAERRRRLIELAAPEFREQLAGA